MGCNICRNQKDEGEIDPYNISNHSKDNKNVISALENKPDLKTNVSMSNLDINKENILKNNNNIDNKINKNIDNKNNNININNISNNINSNNNITNRDNKNSTLKNSKIISDSKSLSFNRGDYNSRIIDLINEVRLFPSKYSDIILNNIQYITKERRMIANDETGQNEEIEETIFQKKVKVKINEGERAFIKAADLMKRIKPMDELEVKEEIKLEVPENEKEMNDTSFIKNQLNELRKKNNNISSFFKDYVKNPEIGLLLMIVGDNKNGQNKKRNELLNPENKYIGVNSKFIGNTFVAYFTFSK